MLMGKTLNGNVMCSVAIRTTGKDPKKDDIYQICILPLDRNYKPVIGAMFDKYIQVRPENVSKIGIVENVFAKKHSVVWDMIDEWAEHTMKKGQIIPLVYDWPSVQQFMTGFISEPGMEILVCDKARDLKAVALYLNDLHEADEKVVPFSKTTLRYILNNCECSLDPKYNAVEQAIKMAQAYKKMLRYPF